MSRVLTTEPFWHEDVYRFSNELLTLIAEKLFDMSIHQHNAALIVYENDTARRGFRGQAEQILCLLLRCYVYGNADDPDTFAVLPGDAASPPAHPAHSSIR